MLFSIVIPVYNVEKFLDHCIQSVLSQIIEQKEDCEIILVDDGSTDNSAQICDYYEKEYPSIIKVYHKKNEGLLATRRFGYKRASGEYIINCDSDDFLEHKMIESLKGIIFKYNYPDIILVNHYKYDGKNKIVDGKDIFSNKNDSYISKERILREYMKGDNIVSVCGKVLKYSCIDIDRDYKEYGKLNTGEDTLQSIEFFSNANTFVYLNEALYNYRCGSGMTARFDADYFFTFKNIFEQIKAEKDQWNLRDFDQLFAIKVLQTAGRAITQARFNNWESISEQKQYLEHIYNDSMLIENIKYLNDVKKNIQWDHYFLLILLRYKFFIFIVLLLRIKNRLSKVTL